MLTALLRHARPPSPLAGRLATQSLLFAAGEGTFLTGSAVFFTQIVGLSAAEVGIHHRHVHRLGADGLHGFGPAVRRDPLEAVGVKGPESEHAFGWDGCQEQMSQNGPYLSQKGP